MDDWAKIRQLFSTGQHSKREIGRLVGVSRGTVDRALESDRLPKYRRASTVSSFDAYAAQVRVLLAGTPRMPASTLAERVGWLGSASVFRDKVAAIRPEYVPPDPADRLVHEPGKQVQCDLWFPHEPLPLGHGQEGMPPVLVMTSTFSGFFQALMLPSRTTSDLLGGMWSLLQAAGAVPPRLTWDNETGIGKGKLTERTAAFAGTLSNFKSWLRGTHRGVSAEHLQVYLDEFIFRYNRRRTPMAAFQTLLGLSSQHPPSTRAEIVAEGPAAAKLG
jgi:hypothetical protein